MARSAGLAESLRHRASNANGNPIKPAWGVLGTATLLHVAVGVPKNRDDATTAQSGDQG